MPFQFSDQLTPAEILEGFGFKEYYHKVDRPDRDGDLTLYIHRKLGLKAWFSLDDGNWGIQFLNNRYLDDGSTRDLLAMHQRLQGCVERKDRGTWRK